MVKTEKEPKFGALVVADPEVGISIHPNGKKGAFIELSVEFSERLSSNLSEPIPACLQRTRQLSLFVAVPQAARIGDEIRRVVEEILS